MATTDPLPPEPHPQTTDDEPLRNIGLTMTLAVALIALLVSFGLPLDDRQQAAILAVLAAAAPLATALWGRTRVYSPRSVARLLAASRRPGGPPMR